MHMLDGFTIVIEKPEKDKKCTYAPTDKKREATLEGSSSELANQLEKSGKKKPQAKSIQDLSSTAWPSQAHHIIPHKTLAKHPIKNYLKKGKNLYESTKYHVDHHKNGMWLPYAYHLQEWSQLNTAEKRKLLFRIMSISGLQIHTGAHYDTLFKNAEAGYQTRVKSYLKKIYYTGISHYAEPGACDDCKKDPNKGNKYPARDETRRYTDIASYCLKKDILNCKIFVSSVAADCDLTGGIL